MCSGFQIRVKREPCPPSDLHLIHLEQVRLATGIVEFAPAATSLRNPRGSCSVINKTEAVHLGTTFFQQRSPDVMPSGLYKYPEPIRAV